MLSRSLGALRCSGAFAQSTAGRSGYDGSRRLCFMHIPKTAGTSLSCGLKAAFGSDVLVSGFDHVLFGNFSEWSTLRPSERDFIYAEATKLPQWPTLIMGHFAYSTLAAAYPGAQMITVLREPTSRLLSHWLFWRRLTDDDLAGLGSWADYVRHARRPLAEFLNEPRIAAQTDNLATRMLLWPHPLIPLDGFIDPAHDRVLIREARRRLGRFAFVDLVERPNLTNQIEAWLGRSVSIGWHNETTKMPLALCVPLAAELSATSWEKLEHSSRLDLILWRSIAVRGSNVADIEKTRQQTIVRQVARFAGLMAG